MRVPFVLRDGDRFADVPTLRTIRMLARGQSSTRSGNVISSLRAISHAKRLSPRAGHWRSCGRSRPGSYRVFSAARSPGTRDIGCLLGALDMMYQVHGGVLIRSIHDLGDRREPDFIRRPARDVHVVILSGWIRMGVGLVDSVRRINRCAVFVLLDERVLQQARWRRLPTRHW